ncbi:MAG: heme-copper oxidase subunit III [Gemmataceae bacterium]|nr:heme-copper oxidase subunit III [Gemmataceae bacterium]
MEHAVAEEKQMHMGLPLSNGKLAMWLFLVTEIMFFTGLIGTYIVLRNGSRFWPTPHQVHLVEWLGALNTFVLICSSVTVVLAHSTISKGDVKTTLYYMFVTLALGAVFLGVKAVEYSAKFEHHILPGQIRFDRFESTADGRGGVAYRKYLREELVKIQQDTTNLGLSDSASKESVFLLNVIKSFDEGKALTKEQVDGLDLLLADQSIATGVNWGQFKPKATDSKLSQIEQIQVISAVAQVLHDKHPNLHLEYIIPQGNVWASCYFVMTGFHAIHVLGGLVVFIIIILLGALGKLGVRHESMIELTGLYWHFVDIVWIFLFPLLYLV